MSSFTGFGLHNRFQVQQVGKAKVIFKLVIGSWLARPFPVKSNHAGTDLSVHAFPLLVQPATSSGSGTALPPPAALPSYLAPGDQFILVCQGLSWF